jgi:hypothetical protein
MKFLFTTLAIACFIPMASFACGPSPQKVVREITIKADPIKVWAIVGDFGGMHKWHPNVLASTLDHKKDTEGVDANYRILVLKAGGTIVEKQRDMKNEAMKISVVMVQGDMAVSNYSDAITVKPSSVAGESVVTWVGRFNNKANAMQAAAGEDNAAAIATVEAYYNAGLQGLKQIIEEVY